MIRRKKMTRARLLFGAMLQFWAWRLMDVEKSWAIRRIGPDGEECVDEVNGPYSIARVAAKERGGRVIGYWVVPGSGEKSIWE